MRNVLLIGAGVLAVVLQASTARSQVIVESAAPGPDIVYADLQTGGGAAWTVEPVRRWRYYGGYRAPRYAYRPYYYGYPQPYYSYRPYYSPRPYYPYRAYRSYPYPYYGGGYYRGPSVYFGFGY